MEESKLKEILRKHRLWLKEDPEGEKADLRGEDLRRMNFSRTDLRCVDFKGADLRFANFSYADLSNTNFNCAVLSGADFSESHLRYTNFNRADLSNANLSSAHLINAYLGHAYLSGANLSNIKYNEGTAFFALCCPEKGDFIGYKKAGDYIVELLITGKRSSATTRKCRCSEAKVLSITNLDGSEADFAEVCSDRDKDFIYKVGEIVKVDDFDDDRWNECSTGIHFFITRDEAVNY